MYVWQLKTWTTTGSLCLIVSIILGSLNRHLCSVLDRETRSDHHDGHLILTPYVENGETLKAKELLAVEPSLFAGVNSHAAYFTVDKVRKWNLFFWYFPAQGVDLERTPLVIWLQGGPGGSSLYGLFEEIGPLQIINGSVQKRNITWGSSYSLLFIDNPVGTGFSFTEGGEYVTSEHQVGQCLLRFIQQFLHVFPELRTAPLFIAGESYAGKYIPAFGHHIHHNKDIPINLRNASKATTILYDIAPVDFNNYKNGEAAQFPSPSVRSLEKFLNKPEVQNALHVKSKYSAWDETVYGWLRSDEFKTVKPWLEDLVEHYGVLCYNGQLDMLVPYALSVRTYRSLKWSGTQQYLNANRELVYDEENSSRVNSFVKTSDNFMEAMVVGAGHMVAADQPRAAKQIIDMFINRHK